MPLALLARPLPRTAVLTSIFALSVSLSLRTSPLSAPRAMSSRAANAPGWDPVARPFPAARRSDASATYKSKAQGEVVVPEPYDWLETPPSQSSETKTWVEAQAQATQEYIDGYPDRAVFKRLLESSFSYPRTSCPSAKGDGAFYYSYNSGLDPQSTIYRATAEDVARPTGDTPVGEKWFDQNLMSKDGTVALSATSFSKSGKYFAYGISKAGSDWLRVYVRPTSAPFNTPPADGSTARTGGPDRLEDEIRSVKFSGITWLHDDSGFFYQAFPEAESIGADGHGTETDANKDARLHFHKIGTKQSEDVLVVAKDPVTRESMWSTVVSDDGEWLILSNSKDTDTKARTYVATLKDQKVSDSMKWIPLSTDFKSELSYLGNDGTTFYFMTNRDAANYKIVRIELDASSAQSGHPAQLSGDVKTTDLLAEDKDALLSTATIINENKLVIIYSRNVQDEVWQYELKSGKQIKRLLPELVGTVTQFSGRREDSTAYVSTMSFVSPGTQTRLDWGASAAQSTTATPEESVYRTTLVAGIKPDDFVSEQRWFESKDGTKVPMFLTRRKDTPLDGTAPTWCYFYGGFNIPLAPTFSPSLMTWVQAYGGVLAWVNARGGGEFGGKWHDAGRLLHKQNVFDDVLAACEYLKTNKISGVTIVNGGSNGGLGAMAVGNQAEEKHGIGAVVAEVGVHDMLKFSTWTIGAAWCADYGNPIEDPVMFDYNYKYSPLHNVNPNKTYPTVAILSSDHDDRVVPAHSFKMVAELQHKHPENPNPILARLELNAGHGAGKSTQKRIEEACDKYAIVARSLGLQLKNKTAAL